MALETSLEGTLKEDRLETRVLIEQSLDFKRSLSLVSRSFHALVEEFLYEILLIRRPLAFTRLSARLRQKPLAHGRPSRGWWVRRLELDFDVNRRLLKWTEGWDNLWGLLSACSHLQVLRLNPRGSIRAEFERGRYYSYNWSAGCSVQLLQNIAGLHGRTLRRIEFGESIVVKPSHFAEFLSQLPVLELGHASSIGFVSDHIAHRVGSDSQPDPAPWPQAPAMNNRLLHLHTLHVELPEIPKELVSWTLPSLKHLHVTRADESYMEEHTLKFLRAHDRTIRSLYHERQVYSPFDRLWQVFTQLPSLEHLLLADAARSRWNWLLPLERHDHLRTITVYRRADTSDRHDSLMAQLDDLLKALEKGRLPALRNIRILGDDVGRDFIRRVRLRHFDSFDIRWDIHRAPATLA
ncbi:hypothetical protein CALVIDRAFT_538985 [Calocera viscosa TUFC12733]|uniref:F-box domain-containing protein n=1 Tax=Calocera viscosa (strain TUFC12733) TaxID=1330018 RepID=A0A167KDK0_CALVF|nr:hypothetical protein CALVIDRAFT_538985 [Calocera viscosa TUFC12733]